EERPKGWAPARGLESMPAAELRAIIADTLAIRIGAESQLTLERQQFANSLQAERQKSELLRDELEALRYDTTKSIQQFQRLFEKRLSAYRSERAWRVMLGIRKAYTLLVRRKLRGILPLLTWALGRNGSLDEFEPVFPN